MLKKHSNLGFREAVRFLPFPLKDLEWAERRTYTFDSFRGGVDGALISLDQSVFLLVAIQFFAVADLFTSLIASAKFTGLLLTLLLTTVFGRRKWKKSSMTAVSTIVSGVCLVGAGLHETFFVPGVVLHLIFIALRVPLLTSIYEENYAANRRGRLYSTAVMLSILCGLGTSLLYANVLDRDISLYSPLFIGMGLFTILSGGLFFLVPSGRFKRGSNPLKDLSLLVKNKLFGLMCLSWSILGFANLWSLPLRIVHLAEQERGLGLSPFQVVLVLSILPNLLRLGLNHYWAGNFDKHHILHMRIVINLFIGSGILIFFLGKTLPVVAIGSGIMTCGFAGGAYLWNLWVTKIAPPGETHRYMTVHTFLAGVRGIISPFIGFLAAGAISLQGIGFISFGMMVVSCCLLLPAILEHRQGSTKR